MFLAVSLATSGRLFRSTVYRAIVCVVRVRIGVFVPDLCGDSRRSRASLRAMLLDLGVHYQCDRLLHLHQPPADYGIREWGDHRDLSDFQIVCITQNAVIAFTTICLFSWLFLYALHIYRTISESEDPTRYNRRSQWFFNGFSLWRSYLCIGTIPALLVALTTLFSAETTPCRFAVDSMSAWLILVPASLFLLVSVALNCSNFSFF